MAAQDVAPLATMPTPEQMRELLGEDVAGMSDDDLFEMGQAAMVHAEIVCAAARQMAAATRKTIE